MHVPWALLRLRVLLLDCSGGVQTHQAAGGDEDDFVVEGVAEEEFDVVGGCGGEFATGFKADTFEVAGAVSYPDVVLADGGDLTDAGGVPLNLPIAAGEGREVTFHGAHEHHRPA